MRETAWNVLYFPNVICIICFVSKINTVSKKLPKMPHVSNVIQKIYHKQNDMANILELILLKCFITF